MFACNNVSTAQCTAATFAGILAANPERQFTQEAITSTGGLMTDVNLQSKTHKPQKQFFVVSRQEWKRQKKLRGLVDTVKAIYLCSSMYMRDVSGNRQSETVQSVLMILLTRSRMGFTRAQCATTS